MSNYSKILTALPILVGLLFVGLDYAVGFEINESQVRLIEYIIGGTILGGVSNAGFKKFTDYKAKIKPI